MKLSDAIGVRRYDAVRRALRPDDGGRHRIRESGASSARLFQPAFHAARQCRSLPFCMLSQIDRTIVALLPFC
ncbi:MAG: hypothetical protein ACTHL1_04630 [Burkholderiaceae bacterium]